ncbi:hypothetical protein [Acetobacter senegalensis]|uniref:hypothetical protein n=1 Tax=Acetobacter senegalensis TaxID=446692 RepID=UPI001EDB1412|nr:hypothetical protein [Acetobacter senegalensis]MCG4258184.1 hypothetical protein [Acetobacter senegalensis]MCG4268111.1 hypothetical protein [Acetobacter senegalensis]
MAKTKNTTNSVSVKPIIFSAEMVRALLDGRKTQTRRVMKVQPDHYIRELQVGKYHPTKIGKDGMEYPGDEIFGAFCDWGEFGLKAPYIPGDLLWVKETWRGIVKINAPWEPHEEGVARYTPNRASCAGIEYKASHVSNDEPWRASIHMPRWASRLTMRVTNVRAERLQDISEDDARAEGVRKEGIRGHALWSGRDTERPTLPSARQAFLDHIWTDLYGEHETKSVGANPWVWVYDFEVIRKNVDEVA